MSKNEPTRQETLQELARRFQKSAKVMNAIAERIQAAADLHRKHDKQLARTSRELRNCVDGNTGPLPFSYLEFLEFASTDEFSKFKDMPVISEDEINALNWEELSKKLLDD